MRITAYMLTVEEEVCEVIKRHGATAAQDGEAQWRTSCCLEMHRKEVLQEALERHASAWEGHLPWLFTFSTKSAFIRAWHTFRQVRAQKKTLRHPVALTVANRIICMKWDETSEASKNVTEEAK
jgi:hypothetical protein